MLFEPGERSQNVASIRARITGEFEDQTGRTLLAKVDDRAVDFVGLHRGSLRRTRHVDHLDTGLLSAHCGRGQGTRLMTQAEAWARAHGLRRMSQRS